MRNDLIHELIGYDPSTDHVVYREKISNLFIRDVLPLVEPDPEDPDAIDSYAVELRIANDIISIARLPKGPQNLEYFVESLALTSIN